MSKVGEEIKRKIETNNELIEKILDVGQFILNERIVSLAEENDALQKVCPHEYEDGLCIYCSAEEDV